MADSACSDDKSWLDEDSALSSEPESSDTESNFGKCRRTGASSRAPKPYSKSGNKPWTPEADDELRRLVATTPLLPTGKRDWTYMAKQLSKKVTVKRIAKQCRERYDHHARPGLNKTPYTVEEWSFAAAQRRDGEQSWARIVEAMGTNRSDNDLKNKFNAMKRKEKFSEEELRSPAAVFIAYVKEVQAAEASAPQAAAARQPRSRQRAASVDSDSGNASESPSSRQPRVARPRRQVKPLRRLADEQAAVVDEVGAVEAAWPAPAADPWALLFPDELPVQNPFDFDAVMANKDFGPVNDAAEDELLFHILWPQQ